MTLDVDGKVALITGGSNGIGEGVARHLAGRGARVVIADLDVARGKAVAEELGGRYIQTDVADPRPARPPSPWRSRRSAGSTSRTSTPASPRGAAWETTSTRRLIGARCQSTWTGWSMASQPLGRAIKASGGGTIVATASMAGLVAAPFDPIYAANKHAVVGLARSLGQVYEADGIRIHALCPSFAYTNIIKGSEQTLLDMGFPIIDVADVVAAFQRILDADSTGQCWYVVAGRPSEPFEFRRAPGPRLDWESPAGGRQWLRSANAGDGSRRGQRPEPPHRNG